MKKIFFAFVLVFMFFLVGCDGLPTNVTVPSGLTTIEEEPTSMVTTENATEAPTTVEPITTVDGSTQTQAPTDEPTTSSGITSRVYFYNSEGWASVYAYTWNDEEEEPLGDWPGTQATKDGDSDWYYIDAPGGLMFEDIQILFNNGVAIGEEGLKQTPDVLLDNSTDVYVLVSGDTYGSKSAAETAYSSTRIYFYNSENWTEVYAYAWKDSTNYLGGWPGQLAVEDTDDSWYYVDVPVDTSEIAISIIFNNGEEPASQTSDIAIVNDREIYITMKGVYSSKALAEEAMMKTTIWFYNSDEWTSISAQANDGTSDLLGEGGSPMTQDGNSDWYFIEVDVNVNETSITLTLGNGSDQVIYTVDDLSMVYATIEGNLYTSKALAESAMAPDKTTIYFYDSEGWNVVYAYFFNDEDEPVIDIWPGNQMTKDGTSDWYYIDVPLDTSQTSVNVVFNNNNSGLQSPDIVIDNDTDIYATWLGNTYSSKTLAEDSLDVSTRIYFYNSEGWTEVYGHAWIGNASLLGPWPGSLATVEVEGQTDWYYIDVPVDTSQSEIGILFHNNDGQQTPDMTLNTATDVYVSINGVYSTKSLAEQSMVETTFWFYNSDEWADVYALATDGTNDLLGSTGTMMEKDGDSLWYSITVGIDASVTSIDVTFTNGTDNINVTIDDLIDIYAGVDGNLYDSKLAAEMAMGPSSTTIYFYNSEEWTDVYAYVFGGQGELLGAFPGTLATIDTDADWYFIEVPTNTEYNEISIIFSNGSGEQSLNTTINDRTFIYVTIDGIYDSMTLAEESMIGTTIWFYNSDGWADVYALATDGTNDLLGTSGTAMNKDGDSLWYWIKVDVDISVTPIDVTFTNGSENVFVTMSLSDYIYASVDGYIYDNKTAAEISVALETTSIYFYNSQSWASVNAYVFGNQGELLGTWPGIGAVQEASTDWWIIDVPVDTGVNPIKIIFTNADGSVQSGQADIEDLTNIYVNITGDSFSSKTLAEDALNTTTSIYFYNSEAWTEVYAYVYGTSGELLGDWPGTQANAESESGWYSVNLPLDTSLSSVIIKFNNNDNGLETSDILIDTNTQVYLTVENVLYDSMLAAQASLTHSFLWFYNSEGWTDVTAKASDGTNELLGASGQLMIQDGTSDWYYIDLGVDLSAQVVDVELTDGTSTVLATINNSSHIYMTVNGDLFDSKTLAEASMESVITTIYYYNSEGWADVYAFVFDDLGNLLDAWPGNQMVNELDSDWWGIDVPKDPSIDAFTVVFHNNNEEYPDQTIDVLINSQTHVYVDWLGRTYDSKQALSDEISQTTRIYFYNSEGWANVYAFAYDDNTHLFYGGWPGVQAMADTDPNWYYQEVPVDVNNTPITIIFNNNDNGLQTPNININSSSDIYVTVDGQVFDNKNDAEESQIKTTIWFNNASGWGSVNAYASDGTNDLLTDTGSLMTQDGSSDWYYIDVPVDIDITSIDMSFSDGGSNTISGVTLSDTVFKFVNPDGSVYQTKNLAEMALTNDITRIHFYNSMGWDQVYAYVADQVLILPNWPGMKAIQDGSSDWWYIDLPEDTLDNPVDVTFNQGDASETSGLAIINSLDRVYVTMTGQTFTNQGDAETAMTASTRIYYYNSEGWADVSAYINSETTGTLLGAWPGMNATQDGTSDWWYIDVPVDTALQNVPIEFTNNEELTVASEEVLINSTDGVYVSYYGHVFTSKTAIENEIAGLSTTIYFYNSQAWQEVYAFAYIEPGNLLTSNWPGDLATQDGSTNWWSVDIPIDTALTDITIIFTNGDGVQTPNILISDETNIYTDWLGGRYDNKSAVESAMAETTRVYYYNSKAWTEVYAFATLLVDANTVIFDSNNGVATQDGTSNWYYIDLPMNTSTYPVNIYFNDNQIEMDMSYEMVIDYQTNLYANYYGGLFADKQTVEDSLVPTTVYFYNTEGWTDINAYTFNDEGTLFLGAWAGTLMTEETGNWWYIEIPFDVSLMPQTIIFSSSGGSQTPDITLDSTTHVYANVLGDLYTSKALVEDAMSVSTTIYFYNYEGWTEVSAFVYGDQGLVLGGWPGTSMVEDSNGWWTIDVPVDTGVDDIAIVFNNNDNGLQTQDFFITDSINVYFVPSDGGFSDKTTAESSLESTTRLYFYNPASLGWTATAHIWDYSGVDTTWPGITMTQLFVDDDNDPLTDDVATDWYYVDISTDTSEFKAIISNNGSPQTNNITIYSYDEIFLTLGDIDGNYNVNRYLSMSLAEESLSAE